MKMLMLIARKMLMILAKYDDLDYIKYGDGNADVYVGGGLLIGVLANASNQN